MYARTRTCEDKKRQRKTIQKLRLKLCSTEDRLVERAKEMDKLKKRLKILEILAKRKQVIINMRGRDFQRETKKWHYQLTYIISSSSQRRLMSTLVSSFLHRDDASTVINGKSREIQIKEHTFQRKALTDTMANLHKRFLSENPRHSLSEA